MAVMSIMSMAPQAFNRPKNLTNIGKKQGDTH